MTAWMITVPKGRIKDFENEARDAKLERLDKNFRIPSHVKSPKEGDIVYVVFGGFIQGCMTIKDSVVRQEPFVCRTTNRRLDSGRYIVCDLSGYRRIQPYECKGFQGIRRVDYKKFPGLKY